MSAAISDLRENDKRDWRWVFLKTLAASCCVSTACIAAGVNRDTAYRHRERFPRFRQKWDESLRIAAELLEVEARARALDRKDPSSHILLMFLLKAHDPKKYRDNGHQIPETPPEADDRLLVNRDLSALNDDDLLALEGIARKLAGQPEDAATKDPR